MPGVNFDRIARPYRWLEYLSFGPWLARCRAAQLARLTAARRALLLGDGDGRFLARLLACNPGLSADVVDSSQTMLRLLGGRVAPFRARIRLYHADVLAWKPPASYDLIVSHFFLDCFFPAQIEQMLDIVLPHALPGAQWVVSEFAIPRNPILACLARALIGLLYRAFALLTGLPVRALPDYPAALRGRGLIAASGRSYLGGLLRSQLWLVPSNPRPK